MAVSSPGMFIESMIQQISHSVIQSVGRSDGQHAREPLYGNQPEEVGW